MAAGRIGALDVGERTIGVALSDPDQIISSPFTTVRRTSLDTDLEAVARIVREQEIVALVVGMPRSLSGELHFQAEKTARFIERLRVVVAVPIETWDERFSTAEAERALLAGDLRRDRRKQVIDQTAAAVILQGYLAARQHRESGPQR